jgi:hypothetical protein
MSQDFQPGDFLVFQLEAGYGLMRVLDFEGTGDEMVWHVAAFDDLFFDIDSAERAINAESLSPATPHLALTSRAFESTQVAKISNIPVQEAEIGAVREWQTDTDTGPSDRSIRLHMGVR